MSQNPDEVSKSTKNAIVITAIILAVLVAAYFVVLFETYRNNTFIFSKDNIAPDPSLNAFYPTGDITQLTQDEIDRRQEFVNNLLTSA
uniref:Uncharacterized protein n=1 Tax=viral metagenome TaxID=1070528 RepID=A0A6C0JSH8_9ZZZZ